MPEFILDHGSPEAASTFKALDGFTQGYIEAMFFTNASDPDDGDLADATVTDLAPETLELIKSDCAAFQAEADALLSVAYDRDYEPEQAGRDFWFTRNGHGVGFWDRAVLDADDLGDKLSEVARKAGGYDLYCGDDGLIYLA